MSRSRRKSPFTGNTTKDSEKIWKSKQQRKLRRKVKQRIQELDYEEMEEDALIDGDVDSVSDVWDGPKDGKFRIDPKKHEKLMRK